MKLGSTEHDYKRPTTVYIAESQIERLNAISKRANASRSDFIRDAIGYWLDHSPQARKLAGAK